MDDIKSPSAVTIRELSRIVKKFEEKIQNGTEDPDRFLTLTEIEELWGKLIGNPGIKRGSVWPFTDKKLFFWMTRLEFQISHLK